MPILYNPADCRLPCPRLDRFIDAGERIKITDEEAADLEHNPVFRVERPAAKRETVKRGSKQAEVTRAPKRETRG